MTKARQLTVVQCGHCVNTMLELIATLVVDLSDQKLLLRPNKVCV